MGKRMFKDIHNVLGEAKQAAGAKDVRISGGANIIQQFLNAGLVDELHVHIAPIMLGDGIRLFDNLEKGRFSINIDKVIHSPLVTHITYNVANL